MKLRTAWECPHCREQGKTMVQSENDHVTYTSKVYVLSEKELETLAVASANAAMEIRLHVITDIFMGWLKRQIENGEVDWADVKPHT